MSLAICTCANALTEFFVHRTKSDEERLGLALTCVAHAIKVYRPEDKLGHKLLLGVFQGSQTVVSSHFDLQPIIAICDLVGQLGALLERGASARGCDSCTEDTSRQWEKVEENSVSLMRTIFDKYHHILGAPGWHSQSLGKAIAKYAKAMPGPQDVWLADFAKAANLPVERFVARGEEVTDSLRGWHERMVAGVKWLAAQFEAGRTEAGHALGDPQDRQVTVQ